MLRFDPFGIKASLGAQPNIGGSAHDLRGGGWGSDTHEEDLNNAPAEKRKYICIVQCEAY